MVFVLTNLRCRAAGAPSQFNHAAARGGVHDYAPTPLYLPFCHRIGLGISPSQIPNRSYPGFPRESTVYNYVVILLSLKYALNNITYQRPLLRRNATRRVLDLTSYLDHGSIQMFVGQP
jgi:hypothetical protein